MKTILILLAAAVMIAAAAARWLKRSRNADPKSPGAPLAKASASGDPLLDYLRKMEADGMAHPWAGWFQPSELHRFLELVGGHQVEMGLAEDVETSKLTTLTLDLVMKDNALGLTALAELCRDRGPESWEGLVDTHFTEIKQRKFIRDHREDFQAVKDLIMPRLLPGGIMDAPGVSIIARRYLPDLACILMFDTASGNFNVTQEDAEKWGRSEDDLIKLAFRNLIKKYPPAIRDSEIDGLPVKLIADSGNFDATYALTLDKFPELCGPQGTLVGLPSPSVLLAVPVHRDHVNDLKDAVAGLVLHNYQSYPLPLSKDLYWRREGKWTKIEIDPADYVPDIPVWAGSMDQKQFDRLLQLISDYFRETNTPVEIDAARGELKIDRDGLRDARFFLNNLAGMCLAAPPANWPEVIAGHFHNQQKSLEGQAEFKEQKKDFEQVKTMILPRLYSEEMKEGKLVTRPGLEGAVLALVYDLPTVVTNVAPEDLTAWGKGEDELFKLAFRNLRTTYPPHFTEHELEPGVKLKVLTDEHFFNASYAFLLESQVGLVGPRGSIFGVPHRGALMVYPVADANVIKVIPRLAYAIAGMFRDGPGSISPHLYWYREGEFRRLPYRFTEKSFEFRPPEEFTVMLNELAGPDRDSKS